MTSSGEQQEYLTKSKYKELEKELEHLKQVRRKEIADNLEYARSLGDLSENAEYHEARDMQAQIENRIQRLEQVLKSAKIVSKSKKNEVDLGTVVILRKEDQKKEKKYQLVGSEEADIKQNKISYLSPLGKAIMNKKKGELFSFITPNGEKINYKIIDIE